MTKLVDILRRYSSLLPKIYEEDQLAAKCVVDHCITDLSRCILIRCVWLFPPEEKHNLVKRILGSVINDSDLEDDYLGHSDVY